MDCKQLFQYLFNLRKNDFDIYKILLEKELRADEIGRIINKDRSTVQRCLKRLMKCMMVERKKRRIKEGGYYYVYKAVELERLKNWVEKCIDALQKEMKKAIKNLEREIKQF